MNVLFADSKLTRQGMQDLLEEIHQKLLLWVQSAIFKKKYEGSYSRRLTNSIKSKRRKNLR